MYTDTLSLPRTLGQARSQYLCSGLSAIRANQRVPGVSRRSFQVVRAVRQPHEILGVPINASEADLKAAFREKARRLHPDVNKSPEAAKEFMDVKNAYDYMTTKEGWKQPPRTAHTMQPREVPHRHRMYRTVSLNACLEQIERANAEAVANQIINQVRRADHEERRLRRKAEAEAAGSPIGPPKDNYGAWDRPCDC